MGQSTFWLSLLSTLLQLIFLASLASGLTCDLYEERVCKTRVDLNDSSCRVVSKYCDPHQGTAHCFAMFSNRSKGIVLQSADCWYSHPSCDREKCISSKSFPNRRGDAEFMSHFCCCNGNNCNSQLWLTPNETRSEIILGHAALPDVDDPPPPPPPLVLTTLPPVVSTAPFMEKTSQEKQKEEEGSDSSGYVLISVVVVVCVAFVVVSLFVIYRCFNRETPDAKKHSYEDPESALMMAPLMAEEYKNQDGSLLLKNLQLVEKKANGRYGEVWKGKLGEVIVAVKITPVSEVVSWKNEVHIYHKYLMTNPHPNILRFIIAGNRGPAEQRMFLVTEYQPLGSLVDLLKGRAITFDEAERLSCTMLAGISFLHDTDGKPAIAHRDFKSTNVLIRNDMSVCIADYGLATAFEHDERIGDRHGQVGTRRYMAPELLEGAISLNVISFLRVDIYACGLVLWEIISRTQLSPDVPVSTFKLPFEEELGLAPTNEAIHAAIVHKRIRPNLKDSWKNDPRGSQMCSTIEECWDADPEARPSASCLSNRMRSLSPDVAYVDENMPLRDG